MESLEYANGKGVTNDLKANAVPILAILTLISPILVYLWQIGRANTESIIRLESQQVTPKGLTTESGTVRKDLNKKIDGVSAEVKELRSEMGSGFKEVRAEFKADIRELRLEMKADNRKTNDRIDRLHDKVDDINKILLERLPPPKKK